MPDSPPATGGSSLAPRRSAGAYPRTLALGLVSAATVLVGVSRPWVSATATLPRLPTIHAEVDGAVLAPLASALAVVSLAAFGAVLATRGRVRRGLGALVVVSALVVGWSVVHPGDTGAALEQGLSARGWPGGSYDASTSVWRWVVGAGALGCLLAGLLVARFGGGWATMSTRYDAPGAATESSGSAPDHQATESDLWRSIDRGHDPTQTP